MFKTFGSHEKESKSKSSKKTQNKTQKQHVPVFEKPPPKPQAKATAVVYPSPRPSPQALKVPVYGTNCQFGSCTNTYVGYSRVCDYLCRRCGNHLPTTQLDSNYTIEEVESVCYA